MDERNRLVSHRNPKTRLAELDYYYVPEGDEPMIGDLIVTSINWGEEAPDDEIGLSEVSECLENAKFARIIRVHNSPTPKAKKFYLKLIGRRELRDSHSTSRKLLARMAEAEEARIRLDELLAQQDNTARYQQLAKSSPEAAELLKKLNLKED